jgi:hypothetical protein
MQAARLATTAARSGARAASTATSFGGPLRTAFGTAVPLNATPSHVPELQKFFQSTGTYTYKKKDSDKLILTGVLTATGLGLVMALRGAWQGEARRGCSRGRTRADTRDVGSWLAGRTA